MDENKKIEQLRQQGWEDMSGLLDIHMPQENNRRPILWYWLAGAAAVLLAVGIPLGLLLNSSPENAFQYAGQEQILTQKEKSTTNIENDSDINISSELSDDAIVMGSVKNLGDQIDKLRSFTSDDASKTIRKSEYNMTFEGTEGREIERNDGKTQKNNSNQLDNSKTFQGRGHSQNTQSLSSFYRNMLLVESPEREFSKIIYDESPSVEVLKSSGKVKVYVFAETMWSLSDRFGFVNAGPGLQYALGKWKLGLSGGLTIPIPDQKAFYSSNLPFSDNFNFSSVDKERIDNNTPGIAGTPSAVYYEKYSMKPGLVIGLSVRRQIANRWGAGLDLGRVGFRYDFTQKAEPNPNIAANTDLTNLHNSLWYGGLSVNYQLGDHWTVHGGARLVNLLNASDIGLLPVVRLEYGF